MSEHLDLLKPFLENARWFGGKGRSFSITGTRRLGLVPHQVDGGPRTAIDLVTITYEDGGPDEYYQLPLSFYPEAQERLAHALVGVWDDPDFGHHHVYDALHDREAMACWLRSFADPPAEGPLAFHSLENHQLDLGSHSTLFSGEQSNSSVMFGDDSLMKVFRKITPGPNPDIAIHDVLTRAGSEHVAALYGWLETPSITTEGEPRHRILHLAMLQEFLRTATDGWDLATSSVRNLYAEGDLHADEVGGDFAAEAARLGEALAETHAVLAEHFPAEDRPADEARRLAAAMHERLDAALEIVPGLAPYAEDLRRAYDALGALDGIRVQQIHGDLHLGQTLRSTRGWKIVDFEGEPAKELSERIMPDSPWRDVAGMLRSLDYAPRVVERTWSDGLDEGADQRAYRANEWSQRNRSSFLAAYARRELTTDERTLLAAYVADKAVYETVYETRNRPSWVGIPLEAVARIGAS